MSATHVLVSIMLCMSIGKVMAAELKVFTAGAIRPVVDAVVPAFEKAESMQVRVESDTAGGLVRRVENGEAFDVLIAPSTALERLVKAGKLEPGSSRAVARVAIGVGVREGAAKPDIGSVPAFRQALLQAKSVAYIDPAAGGSSGIYLSRLFERLGIAGEVGKKSVLVQGGLAAQRLLTGEADIAIQQMSEILAVPGVTLLGPLPEEIQNVTVYAGAVAQKPASPAGAGKFIEMLTSDRVAPLLAEKGMQRP